jgi:hypothetical protein
VSALNFPGNPSRILDKAEAGEIRLAISDHILDEVERIPLDITLKVELVFPGIVPEPSYPRVGLPAPWRKLTTSPAIVTVTQPSIN